MHSLKDMESVENKDLKIGAYIKNDYRDVLISQKIKNISDLKKREDWIKLRQRIKKN